MSGEIQVELQDFMGSDAAIANAAWTSTYDKTKRDDKYDDPEKVNKVVRQLILDRHGTPVESVVLRFWIRMPIFTDRQHMTHRMQSANGASARYRTMSTDYFPVPSDVQEIISKTGSSALGGYIASCNIAVNNYLASIEELKYAEKAGAITNKEFKRAREVIRGQLPTSSMVERTTIMNLRSFANYQYQRNSEHAQPEIKQVAQLMLDAVLKANIAPVAISTLMEIGWDF